MWQLLLPCSHRPLSVKQVDEDYTPLTSIQDLLCGDMSLHHLGALLGSLIWNPFPLAQLLFCRPLWILLAGAEALLDLECCGMKHSTAVP